MRCGWIRADDPLILVSVLTDRRTGLQFYRPLGGGIEFGETSADALRREFTEELGFDVTPTSLLGVLENHFEFEGEPGHEIVHVYAVESSEIDALSLDTELTVLDDGSPVIWKRRDELESGRRPFYPAGVLELLPN
ncbi:NUDIX domain-containing protein [Arthrobacter roseus]|uniref:NUDIX domain-containing protein n=1 Tax=Arthrobacter roseus TaxID=136274 RepID=UPI00196591CB|nr:8-oxo-dGTP pyrophosphatase MutT (NUDIX family) [Arthrobacter roseus]